MLDAKPIFSSFFLIQKHKQMKILKYVLYAIIALVILFFAMGFMNPFVKYGHSITVDKPIKEAWAVMQDASKFEQWLAGFKSIELISGEEGAVGSKYKVIVKPSEEEDDFEMIQTITSLNEFDHVTLDFDSDFMDFVQTTSFEEKDGTTKITTDSKVIGKSIISRAMFAIMEKLGRAFTTQEAENIENLKKVIEENTTDYYPTIKVVEDEVVEDLINGN